MQKSYIIGLFNLWLLSGCEVSTVTTTAEPAPFSSFTKTIELEAKATKDFLVINNSIQLKAIVGDEEFPMTRSQSDSEIWNADIPIQCQESPLQYKFGTDWKYLALILPIPKNHIRPEDGFFTVNFQELPDLHLDPDELLMYGNSTVTEDVILTKETVGSITIQNIISGAGQNCNIGSCDGSRFHIISYPTLPIEIKCSESITITIRFSSTTQSSGILNIFTDMGNYTVPMSGKIFIG